MSDCKYYDSELDICKYYSDWNDAMPMLQPCIKSPCMRYTVEEGDKKQ